jgi:dTDP-glucose 4,6-dehydratase
MDSVFAIGNFIGRSLENKPIRINGDGSPIRSYLYTSDLTTWLWTILFSAPSHRAYNVGSADDLSIKQLAEIVKTTLCNQVEVEMLNCINPSHPISRYVPSVIRAQRELGLKATIPLIEAIDKTARWARDLKKV